MPTLIPMPLLSHTDSSGRPYPGAKCYTYVSLTSTPTVTYADEAGTIVHANPVTALTDGRFPAIYGPTGVAIKFILTDADGGNARTIDPVFTPLTLDDLSATADEIAQLLPYFDRTEAEINGSIIPTYYGYPPGDLRRYGIVANDTTARAANSAALQVLVNPAITNGPSGRLYSPNTSGEDIYYFDAIKIEYRPGIELDLCNSTWDFAGTYTSANTLYGFFTVLRDFTLHNGAINIVYDGSAGTHNGGLARIGSRNGYAFTGYSSGVEDEDLDIPMGNVHLRNLRITFDNPITAAIQAIGGLRGLTIEDVSFDGSDTIPYFFYYEFGFGHYEATAANRQSSHARGISIKRCQVKNLADSSTGAAVALIGAAQASVEHLHVDTAYKAVEVRCGEALYYNQWDGLEGPANISLRHITAVNIASTGLLLTGSESKAGGYLSGVAGLTEALQCDRIAFDVSDVDITATVGMNCSGLLTFNNGAFRGAGASGAVILTDECVFFDINNIRVYDSGGIGIRASFGGNVFGTARFKIGSIRNFLVVGSTGVGISIGNSESVQLTNGRCGYETIYEGSAEATQTSGVSVTSTGSGVVCRGVRIAVSSGNAYALAGNGDRGCAIYNARGTATTSGAWKIDGIVAVTSTNLADKTHAINTADKYVGKLVLENSNHKLYVARATTDVGVWDLVDGSASVTPA